MSLTHLLLPGSQCANRCIWIWLALDMNLIVSAMSNDSTSCVQSWSRPQQIFPDVRLWNIRLSCCWPACPFPLNCPFPSFVYRTSYLRLLLPWKDQIPADVFHNSLNIFRMWLLCGVLVRWPAVDTKMGILCQHAPLSADPMCKLGEVEQKGLLSALFNHRTVS